MQPASFTDPGIPVDLTDVDLPAHCECGAFLPLANNWWVEEDEGELVAYVQCKKCGHVNTVKVAER